MGSGSNRNSKPEVDADALAHDIRAALQPFGTSPAESTDPDTRRRDAHRTKPQSKEEPSHGSGCKSPYREFRRASSPASRSALVIQWLPGTSGRPQVARPRRADAPRPHGRRSTPGGGAS